MEAARLRGRADGYGSALCDVARLQAEAEKAKRLHWADGLSAARLLLEKLHLRETQRAREAEAALEEWTE